MYYIIINLYVTYRKPYGNFLAQNVVSGKMKHIIEDWKKRKSYLIKWVWE